MCNEVVGLNLHSSFAPVGKEERKNKNDDDSIYGIYSININTYKYI